MTGSRQTTHTELDRYRKRVHDTYRKQPEHVHVSPAGIRYVPVTGGEVTRK